MKKAGFVAVCPFEIGDVIMCGSRRWKSRTLWPCTA